MYASECLNEFYCIERFHVPFFFLGSVGGFFLSGAFVGLSQWLLSPPPADVPSDCSRLSLRLPRCVGLGAGLRRSCRRRRSQPVHLPSFNRALLCFPGHGAAARSGSRRPRTLSLCLCSNVRLVLQEGLGQSQGVRQQPAARPHRALPAPVCGRVFLRQRDTPGWGLQCLPAEPQAPHTVPLLVVNQCNYRKVEMIYFPTRIPSQRNIETLELLSVT